MQWQLFVYVELCYASGYRCVCVLVYSICVYTPVPNKPVLYWPLVYLYMRPDSYSQLWLPSYWPYSLVKLLGILEQYLVSSVSGLSDERKQEPIYEYKVGWV